MNTSRGVQMRHYETIRVRTDGITRWSVVAASINEPGSYDEIVAFSGTHEGWLAARAYINDVERVNRLLFEDD